MVGRASGPVEYDNLPSLQPRAPESWSKSRTAACALPVIVTLAGVLALHFGGDLSWAGVGVLGCGGGLVSAICLRVRQALKADRQVRLTKTTMLDKALTAGDYKLAGDHILSGRVNCDHVVGGQWTHILKAHGNNTAKFIEHFKGREMPEGLQKALNR